VGVTGATGAIGVTGATGASFGVAASNYVVQAKRSADQTITSASDNIVQFNTSDFDPQSWLNTSTYRITPNIAGYYEVSFFAWFGSASASNNQYNAQARKNGSTFFIAQELATASSANSGVSMGGTRVVYLNGTTDYLDFTVYNGTGASVTLQATNGTWASAQLISYGTGATGATGQTGATGPAVTNASTLITGTLPDAQLSTNVALKTLLNQWLGMSLSGVDAGAPMLQNASQGYGSGVVHWTFFTPLVTTTVTSITFWSGSSAASGLTLCRFGIYTYDETTATLVARTDSNTGNFALANTAYNRVLSATGGYPTSYTLNAGTRYGVAVIQVGTTASTLVSSVLGPVTASQQNPKLSGYLTGQSDLPTPTTSVVGYTLRPYARLLP